MSKVITTNDSNINPSSPKLDQLDKLAKSLQEKREATTETSQIQMIDAALEKVSVARQEADVGQKIVNNQARLGQYNQVNKPAIQTETTKQVQGVISDKEAEQIVKIKSIESAVLRPGEKFASMNGREPSNIGYMKQNIAALFELTEKA